IICTASGYCFSFASTSANWSGIISGSRSFLPSSLRAKYFEISTAFAAGGMPEFMVLLDERQPALDHHDGVRVLLLHRRFGLDHRGAVDLDHHAFDRHTHLIHHDLALPHLQGDGLHRFRLALAEVDLSDVVAHLDGERIVAHVDDGLAI